MCLRKKAWLALAGIYRNDRAYTFFREFPVLLSLSRLRKAGGRSKSNEYVHLTGQTEKPSFWRVKPWIPTRIKVKKPVGNFSKFPTLLEDQYVDG